MPFVTRAKSTLIAWLAAFTMIAAIVPSSITPAQAAPPEYDALIPALQDQTAERFDDRLIRYDIAIRFRPESNRITGDMTVTIPNFTGQPLDDVAFRLFPNAAYYGEGYLLIRSVTVDGTEVEPSRDSTGTSLFVPLTRPLMPGASTTIALSFRTVIPENSRGTYGIFNHHLGTDDWVLADWHPIVAGWDAELGWRTDPPTAHGDPTYADIGLYDINVTLPDRYSVVATGVEKAVELLSDGLQSISIVTGPSRDLTLVISDELVPLEGTFGESTVRVWTYPAAESQTAAEWVLTESVAALDAWGARYGIFPGIELDLVATPVQQSVLGVSWTGLVMLSDALMLIDTGWIDSSPDTARFAIVHEIGHQWWGNMIGANSNDHPFMVEGLTNALSVEIASEIYGADAAIAMLDSQIAGRFRQALTQNGDGIVDTPAGSEDLNGPGRAALAYGKGALGFLAIRLAMGDDAWHAAMEDFADTYLYDNAEPADLLAMLIAYAPDGVDVPAIWHHWFEEATATTAEIDALAAGIAARLRG